MVCYLLNCLLSRALFIGAPTIGTPMIGAFSRFKQLLRLTVDLAVYLARLYIWPGLAKHATKLALDSVSPSTSFAQVTQANWIASMDY